MFILIEFLNPLHYILLLFNSTPSFKTSIESYEDKTKVLDLFFHIRLTLLEFCCRLKTKPCDVELIPRITKIWYKCLMHCIFYNESVCSRLHKRNIYGTYHLFIKKKGKKKSVSLHLYIHYMFEYIWWTMLALSFTKESLMQYILYWTFRKVFVHKVSPCIYSGHCFLYFEYNKASFPCQKYESHLNSMVHIYLLQQYSKSGTNTKKNNILKKCWNNKYGL